MNLTILGSQGAIPKLNQFSSSHVLQVGNKNILIDCCEGVQFQLRRNKIKLSNIEIILISHAHGDHFFGLMGLLTTLSLLKRDKKLEIFCPVSVLRIVQAHIKHAKMKFSYELKLNGLKSEKSTRIFECPSYIVQTIPLKHSIYTNGFLIKEQPKKRKLLIDKLKDKKIDKIYYNKFTKGLNVIDEDGNEVSYLDVTKEGDNSKSYAYCSDTSFCESIIDTIKGVDLLYCETTFLQRHQDKAISTFHSTTKDAGILAQKAQVKKLLIGHFSSRYDDIQEFFNETKEFFNDVMLSEEGKKIVI